MEINIDWKEVKKAFIEDYNQKNDDFLLFDLAHANENAHTRVLQKLLKYDNNRFLPSFLKQLRLPDCLDLKYNSIWISDQESAIPESKSPNASGYIDLYLRYQDEDSRFVYVIIENKICGAGDTKQQLARYVATVEKGWKKNNPGFDVWYKDPEEITKNICVIYLTADGTKEPNEGQGEEDYSLPYKLEKRLGDRYCPRNYRDDILPWLEEIVKPQIPYSFDGMMIEGVSQYIAYLKKLFITETTSKVLLNYFDALEEKRKNNPISLYKEIVNHVTNIEKEIQEDDKKNERTNPNYDALKQLLNNLEFYKRKIIFKDYAPKDDWELYFTPSFILLYKNSWWSEYDTKKNYNFPSIHLFCSPTNNFINNSKKLSWSIKGVRIPNSEIKEGISFKDGWFLTRGVLVKNLETNDKAKNCNEDYFDKIVSSDNINRTIEEIDKLISKAEINKPYQVALMESVRKEK